MRLKKYYGQHLLTEQRYIDEMVQLAGVNHESWILEIGPGTGLLTDSLIAAGCNVTAIEIDRDFETILRKKAGASDGKLQVEFANFLDVELAKIVSPDRKYTVFANIPYYITSDIIEKLIYNAELFDALHLTVQKEVAERICAPNGSHKGSSFSLFVKYYAESRYGFTIPRDAFTPPPKVDSAFMSIYIREPSCKLKFEEIQPYISSAFQNRRKTIKNSLSGRIDKNIIDQILDDAGLKPTLRAENLSLSDFENLAILHKKYTIQKAPEL